MTTDSALRELAERAQDLRHLIVMDTQYGWNGETTLKLPEIGRLVARGWVAEGDENCEYDITDAGHAAIKSILAAAGDQQPAPAGMVMVPREPTAAMVMAGWDTGHLLGDTRISHKPSEVYAAMLAAAPPPTMDEVFDQLGPAMRRQVRGEVAAPADAPAGCGHCDGNGEVQTGEILNEDDYGVRTCPGCGGSGVEAAALVAGCAPAAQVADDESREEAFSDFESDYLTDGNGYAPASTYEACSAAFNAAWPDRKKAHASALIEFARIHGHTKTTGQIHAEFLRRQDDSDRAAEAAAPAVVAKTYQGDPAEPRDDSDRYDYEFQRAFELGVQHARSAAAQAEEIWQCRLLNCDGSVISDWSMSSREFRDAYASKGEYEFRQLYTAPPSLGGEDAALREDAERWRLLERLVVPQNESYWYVYPGAGTDRIKSAQELRIYIDAARAAEGGERG